MQMNRTKSSVVIAGCILGALGVGSIIHEGGHVLGATMCGQKIEAIAVAPGIQIYPVLQKRDWPGYATWIELSPSEDESCNGWIFLMGSLTTAALSYAGVIVLVLLRPTGLFLRLLMVFTAAFAADIVCYTFLPLVGLRHWIFFGGTQAEPLIGARAIGIPDVLFFSALALHAVLVSIALAYSFKLGRARSRLGVPSFQQPRSSATC